MTRRRVMTAAVTLLIAAASCGSSAGISDSARGGLDALVGKVRAAAVARDRPRAKRLLASLRHSVHQGVLDGEISKARGAEILAAALEVENHLAPFATTTTTTTTTTTVPKPRDEHPEHGKHHGKDKGGPGEG